jgi:hypothetical protein
MELLFPNCEFAWSNDRSIGTAVGCLSLCQGEGEGEDSFTASWKPEHLNPLTSILSPCHKGRGDKNQELAACLADEMSMARCLQ